MLSTTTFDSLSKKVRAAWDARWSGDLESALTQLPELSRAFEVQLLGQESFQSERDWTKGSKETKAGLLQSDTILLVASILRIQGKLSETKTLLDRALSCLNQHGLSGSFRFHFERGLLQYVQGYYLSALEDFFSAERLTSEPLFRIIALSNAMFCMENCDVPHDTVKAEIQNLRKILENSDHRVFHANEKQLLAYEMRDLVRSGQFSKALKLNGSQGRVTGQSDFYSRYITLLPYTTHYAPLREQEAESMVRESERFYQKSYLTRTLLGQTHASDEDCTKISDRIDRLYLWTWTWLNSPETFPVERLLLALNDAITGFDPNRLTLEDQALLRNSLTLLEVIDPSIKSKTLAISRALGTKEVNIPLFDFEWIIIQTLQAIKNNETVKVADTLTHLKNHPLWASQEIELSQIISDRKNPIRLRLLSSAVIDLKAKKSGLLVDLNTFTLKTHGASVISEPMCKALHLFTSRNSVRCEEFFQLSFGMKNYDAFIHLPRINNLISRIKKFTRNQVRFSVRAGTILFKSDESYPIKIITTSSLAESLRTVALSAQSMSFPEKEKTRESLKMAKILSAFGQKPYFKSEDAQVVLQRSKSSVNRFLETLIVRKLLIREGTGPSTVYQFRREAV